MSQLSKVWILYYDQLVDSGIYQDFRQLLKVNCESHATRIPVDRVKIKL
jgi:hypothetical protein